MPRKRNINLNNPHSWINYPNTANRRCTVCGCIKKMTSNGKGKTIVTYELHGVVHEEYIECKPKNQLDNY